MSHGIVPPLAAHIGLASLAAAAPHPPASGTGAAGPTSRRLMSAGKRSCPDMIFYLLSDAFLSLRFSANHRAARGCRHVAKG